MNAPRNDKDRFLYPYAIVITVISGNYESLQHKDIGILPLLQEKGKEANTYQCMNTLSPSKRLSLLHR